MADVRPERSEALDRASPTPFYAQIADRLLDEIETAHVQPGQRIASEGALAARFGVSRMTVRKAVLQLTAKGYLYRRERSGTYVARPRLAHLVSTENSFSASMLATGHRVETIVLEADLRPSEYRTASILGVSEDAMVVIVKRLRIVDGDRVAVHETRLSRRFEAVLEHDLTGSITDLLRAVGAASSRSVDAVEAVNADPEMAALLAVSTGSPIMRVEGIGYGEDGHAVRHTISQYQGDRFRFALGGLAATLDIQLLPSVRR